KATVEQREMATVLLEGSNLSKAQLQGADTFGVWLNEATLIETQLDTANLHGAQMKQADRFQPRLEGADRRDTHRERTTRTEAQLEGINLKAATLSDKSRVGPKLVDAQWGTTNLAVVDWSQVKMLGDEVAAHQKEGRNGEKEIIWRRIEYEAAVRANRQLAVA